MTIYKADPDAFSQWGEAIERELDLTQALAADPHLTRSFRLISAQEFLELTGATSWQWKLFTKTLREEGRLPPSPNNHLRVTLEQVHEYMEATGRRPQRPDGVPRAIRIAIANLKGGASKSTTVFHFGSRLAMRGYRVLLIDLDGQATLTRMCGLQPYLINSEQTFAAAIGMQDDEAGNVTIGEPVPLAPTKTHISGLDLIPAGMAVTSIDLELMQHIKTGSADKVGPMFEAALGAIDEDYDFVLMDFQPSFSLSQMLLLWLADSLVIPVPTETPDFAGTGDFLKLSGHWLSELSGLFGHKTFDPVLAIHARSKVRASLPDGKLSDKEKAEIEEQLEVSNAVAGASGRVFGVHRPLALIEDRPVVAACLANLKSVFEAEASDYDMRAIKIARQQYDALLDRVLEAVHLRWQEVIASEGYV